MTYFDDGLTGKRRIPRSKPVQAPAELREEPRWQKIVSVVLLLAILGAVVWLMFAVYGHDVFWWP